MSVAEILETAVRQQIELWFEGQRLRYRAPSGALPPDLRAALTQDREAILAELRQRATSTLHEHPLSYGQQSLWFLHQTDPHSAAYHVAWTARITSEINLEALRWAFQALIDRHAVLRTTYPVQHGVPTQRTIGYAPVDFHCEVSADWTEAEVHRRAREEYVRPFDLERGPLLRARLFQSAPRETVLLVTVHHIAVDAWSLWILLDELRALYAANTSGNPANLPRPEADYTDFVRWQHERLEGAPGEALWEFWKRQLAGDLPVLNLPADHSHPNAQTSDGASHNFVLDEALAQNLKALAKAENTTLYVVLLAAFQVLLHRLSGQAEVVVGSPTFGRGKAEFARVVGDFINMIPLRANCSGEPTFKEFLAQVRQTVLGALEHQDYPFPRLVARLGGRRETGRSPVFQATFDVQRVQAFGPLAKLLVSTEPTASADFGGLTIQPYLMPQQEGQFDIGLLMVEVEGMLPGTLKYNADLFDASTIARWQRHFQTLLENIVAHPEQRLSELPLLKDAERHQFLVDWNQTHADYPRNLCLHQLFEAQAARTPNATAVIYEDQSLTYAQLNARANQLAHHLRALGVGPEKTVGVYVERSLEMVVAVVGILKSGGAYIPMDPMFPAQRIGYMIEDGQPPVIVTQSALADALPAHNAHTVLIDEDASLQRQPLDNPTPLGDADSLAYVIFTSGSTGRPKGVQIPHRALVNFMLSMQKEPGLTAHDVLASVTTLSFDIAGLELYLPLITGAVVVVLPAETATDGAALAEALEKSHATVLQATPVTWRLLIETGWAGRPGLKILCGGEAFPLPLARQLLERGGEVWNMYGPTETTIWSTLHRVTLADEVIAIGRPIANTEVFILDANLNPTPIGVTGQLYIGGDGLARGYLNRPELTAEKFIAPPFRAGARLYNTGDLARYLPDGRIECLGRSDSQIKLRGFRIELGEIEAVLEQHPAVQQAVVLVREDTPGDQRLVAYLRPAATASPTPRELRGFLRDRLPTYMVPAHYTLLDAFPLTPNGKIDRKALPAPTHSDQPAARAAQPPATPAEQRLAAIWQNALNVSAVSVFDNFFDLGGHSLLAMQVIAQIQEQTGVRLNPVRLRFESLGQLAAALEAAP